MKQKLLNNCLFLINSFTLSKSVIYLIIIVVFLLLALLFYKCRAKNSIRKYYFTIVSVTAVLGLILYFIGYIENENRIFISCLRAIFSTVRMFLLNDDFSAISNGVVDGSIMKLAWFLPIFWTVHVLAFICFAFAIISLFGRKIIEKAKLLFKFRSKVYVICGANTKSLCLLKSIMYNKNRLVIIIDENTNEVYSNKIKSLGGILIKERIFDKGKIEINLLKRVGLISKYSSKEIEFFLLEDDENYNISIAKSLIDVASKNEVGSNRMRLFIHSNDKVLLRDLESKLNNNLNYEVNIINEADLAARKLIQELPIHKTVEIDTNTATIKDKEFTILIVGFGKISREVLLKSICNGQFISGDRKTVPFNAIVVDSQWESKSWRFRNIYKHIEKEYPGITFKPYSSDSEAFYNLLEDKIEDINYIVIATENEQNNLELAKNIQTFIENNNIKWGKKVIAVHMRNQSNLLSNVDENGIYKHIKFFGEYESMFTEEIIINEALDIVAKKINEHYNMQEYVKGEIEGKQNFDNWNKLDFFYKNSNRDVATHLNTKLALLGYEIYNEEENSEFNEDLTLDNYINYTKLENLLRVEHLRWNAFHFINGWTSFTNEDIEEIKKKKDDKLCYIDRKDKINRKHACLVSWEELNDISFTFKYQTNKSKEIIEKFPNITGYQLEDLKQILNIPKFLNYAGIKVKKIK